MNDAVGLCSYCTVLISLLSVIVETSAIHSGPSGILISTFFKSQDRVTKILQVVSPSKGTLCAKANTPGISRHCEQGAFLELYIMPTHSYHPQRYRL
jgi:hypothetical protein